MAKKDLSTDASAASSLASAHFQGSLDSSPTHILCNREGHAFTPSELRDPCKVCELQRKYGEEGYYNKGSGGGGWSTIPVGRGVVLPGLCGPHLGP